MVSEDLWCVCCFYTSSSNHKNLTTYEGCVFEIHLRNYENDGLEQVDIKACSLSSPDLW